MGRMDGSSADGGRQDEPDLRVGNKGISDKDGCWTESDESDWDKSSESDSDESDWDKSYESDSDEPDLRVGNTGVSDKGGCRTVLYESGWSQRCYNQFLQTANYKEQILRFMDGEPLKRLLMLPEIIDRLLMRPEVFKHILMEPELLARLLMEPELLARLLMEPELLARLLKNPVLLARLLMEQVLLACLLMEPELLARLLKEPVLLAHLLKKPVLCYDRLMGLRLSALHFVNSGALHGPDCLSVRNTAMQVKLPSYKTVHDTLAYPKSVVPKTNIHMAGRHGSFYSQPMCVPVRNDGTMSGSNSMVEPLGHAEKPATIHLKSGNSIGTSSKPSLVVLRDTCTEETKDIISTKQRPGDDGFLLKSGVYHSTTAKDIGNVASKEILMLSMADNTGSSSGGNGTTPTSGNYQRLADLVTNHKPIVILDTGAEVNVTGDEAIFEALVESKEDFGLRAANESGMASNCCGFVSHELFQINYVYYCEDVGVRTIISGPELDLLGYTYKCGGRVCEVWDKETLVGKGRLVDETKYLMDFLMIPLDRAVVPPPEVLEEVTVPDGTGPLPMAPLSEVLEEVSVALRELRIHIGAADGTGPLPMAPLSEVLEVEQADVPGPKPMASLSEEPSQVTSVLKAVWTALRRFIGSQFKRTSTEAQRRPPV